MNVASHTPRLAAASSEFRKILDQTPTKLAPDSNVRLFSGIDGSPVVNISAGLNKLAKQISVQRNRTTSARVFSATTRSPWDDFIFSSVQATN